MAATDTPAELLDCTAQIVSAHVARNAVPVADMPDIIAKVYQTLKHLNGTDAPARASEPVPAVPIRKSVYPGFIICLEDGKKLKMLRRHLKTVYGMTPDQYRQRWGLPASYPMVAPAYAERRSSLAKAIGLGNAKRRAATADAVEAHDDAEEGDDAADDFGDDAVDETEVADPDDTAAEQGDAESGRGRQPDLSSERVFANFTPAGAAESDDPAEGEAPLGETKPGRRKRAAPSASRETRTPRTPGRR